MRRHIRSVGWAYACLLILSSSFASSARAGVKAAATGAEMSQSGPQSLWQKMTAAIAARAAESQGVVAVSLVDLTDGQRFALRGDVVVAVASTIKLTILAELLRQSEAGSLALSETLSVRPQDVIDGSPILMGLAGPRGAATSLRPLSLRELAVYMIATSDNTATNALIDRLGMSAVNVLSARCGLSQTRLRRKMLDAAAVQKGSENTATTDDLANLLMQLWQPGVFSDATRRDALHILSVPKDSYFSRGLPDELPLASKPGSLDGLRAEAGIVLVPGRPFVLSAVVAFSPDGAAAERTLADIAQIAHRYFSTLATHTALGRRRPS